MSILRDSKKKLYLLITLALASMQAQELKENEMEEMIKEIRELLCHVAQLIQGWNATEEYWSEWDKKVYDELISLQVKLEEHHSQNSLCDGKLYNPLKFAEWCMFDGAGKYQGSMEKMLKEYMKEIALVPLTKKNSI